jgi:oligoribonuclease
MSCDPQNLIWIDLEMTGLNPDTDRIIEIATIVTDKELNILAQGPVLAIFQKNEVLDAMDDWNKRTHRHSGLVDRIKASQLNADAAQAQTLEFLHQWVPAASSPMCGNSICQDRRFLYREMPLLEAFFHYRNLDVSTLKELAIRWAPEVASGFQKRGIHLALEDIIESIDELKYYRQQLLDAAYR